MDDKKKTAPLATDGTAQTENGSISCDYDSTVCAGNQDVFDGDWLDCGLDDIRRFCEARSITYDELLPAVVEVFLFDEDAEMLTVTGLKRRLVEETNRCIEAYNLGQRDPTAAVGASVKDAYPDQLTGADRLPSVKVLAPVQVAVCVRKLHRAVCLMWRDGDEDGNFDIAMYQEDGEDAGVYDVRDESLNRVIRRYDRTMTMRQVDEVKAILRTTCRKVRPCENPDLIPVNNGVFDYRRKVLMPFSPEHVFTSKCRVDYVEDAENSVIVMPDGEPWDVVSWMDGLSDDPEVVSLLWEIVGAIIRPGVRWNKTAWFYSASGNNGKGTLCSLMRNLCGPGAWASIPLKAFSREFMLELLMRVSAVITDENDTSTYVDDAALKSVITGDPFQLNRKFKDPLSRAMAQMMALMFQEMMRQMQRERTERRREEAQRRLYDARCDMWDAEKALKAAEKRHEGRRMIDAPHVAVEHGDKGLGE